MSPVSTTKEETFRYPISFSLLVCAFILLVFYVLFANPPETEKDEVIVYIFVLLSLLLGFWLIHTSRHYFVATDLGLACFYPGQPRVFISWSEISRVEMTSFSPKLLIYGPAGKKVMQFYHWLDKYQTLVSLVEMNAKNLERKIPQTTLTTASWYYMGILFMPSFFTFMLVTNPIPEGETLAWLMFLLFTGGVWVWWFRLVRKITLEKDGIRFHYFMRARQVRYEDIVMINMTEGTGRETTLQIVEVTLRSGEELKIKSVFNGGSVAGHEVFSEALERARSAV